MGAAVPFGFGLSYTQFEYNDLSLGLETLPAGEPLRFSVTVSNCGSLEGEEVVEVYLSDLEASVPVPLRSLVAFRRVKLAAGESQKLEFTLSPEQMMLFDEEGKQKMEPGQFRLTVGACAPGAAASRWARPAR